MSKITVKASGDQYSVQVEESGSTTTHHVSLDDRYYQKIASPESSKEECIKAAFSFLLDREPKESIMRRFDLTVIRQYFPDFENRLSDYLSAT